MVTRRPVRRLRLAVILALLTIPLVLRSAGDEQDQGQNKLRSCADTDFTTPRLFDVLPLDLSTVMGIVPLGSANGMSHVLPVHVLYLYSPYQLHPDGVQIIPDHPDVPVRAPGDVVVTGLRWEVNSGGHLIAGDDWYVNFRPCDEIRFTYHHLNAITGPPRLVARANQIRRGVRAVCDYNAAGEAVACTGLADVPVSAGEEIGTAFRMNQAGINFSAIDHRGPGTSPPAQPGSAVDPSRYDLTYEQIIAMLTGSGQPIPREFTRELYAEMDPSRTAARCAINYFEPAQRAQLQALLGSFDGITPRLVPPRCGQAFQDSLDGGLTGGWFPESLTTPFLLGGEDILVGFLYGNVLPGKMYFSIGTSVTPALGGQITTFTYPGFDDMATHHNVSFSGARYLPALPLASQPLYCWDGLGAVTMIGNAASGSSPVPGAMLVRFESAARLRFEYAPGQTCAAPVMSAASQVFLR